MTNKNEAIFSVEQLLKYMGNDDKARATVSRIVRDAIAPGMEPLRQAGEAIRDARLTEARRILHTLRGAVGSVGAQRFVTASLALELALEEQRGGDVPLLYTSVEGELKLALEQARLWLDQTP